MVSSPRWPVEQVVRAGILLVLLAPLVAAQDPPPPVVGDTLEVAADTLEVEPDPEVIPAEPVLLLPGSPPGSGLTGVPARRSVFAQAPLLDHVPGAWRYNLGVHGAPEGVGFGLTSPNRLALTLDGRPADDLFTGRAALERLPVDLLAPMHAAPGRYGSSAGIDSYTRAFVAEVPITELRYRAGPDGQQAIGVTHAQTRRPDFIQQLGGEQARLSALLHVSGDRDGGWFTNSEVSGFHVVARVGLALPGVALEVTQRHLQREEGAWGGVAPEAPAPFVRDAPVRDPFAQREVIHNELSLRLRAELIPDVEPLVASLYWTAATHRYHRPDTTAARGHRLGAVIEQRLEFGAHRLSALADLRGGFYRGGHAFGPDEQPLPPEAHLTVRDSLAVAGLDVVLSAGMHASRDFAFPSARIAVGGDVGPFSGHVAGFLGGARLSPVERLGFGELIEADPVAQERTLGFEARAALRIGPALFDVSAELQQRMNPRLLVVEDHLTGRYVSLDGSITRAQLTGGIHFRPDAARGLYATAWVAAQRSLDADQTRLHRLEAEALPDLYGYARLGFRALALFDGNLDLDVFTQGRAWTAHRGRAFHAPTALYGLQDDETLPMIPARGVVDIIVEAGLGRGRARAFVGYHNALAGLAYPGVFVVPIYPLHQPAVRGGIFWVLAN